MDGLVQILGQERSLHEVARTIRGEVQALRAPVVGAALVTCSDESETECADVFQRDVVADLLPSLKFSRKAAFRTANLGAFYEWGSAHIAEQHFAVEASASSFKVMVVKINAHVAVMQDGTEHRFGQMNRYEAESTSCGLLHALLNGHSGLPAVERAREAFRSEQLDRLSLLLDPGTVEPALRPLCAAVVSARLQARRAMLDVQDRRPDTPTYTLILPCVTFNREREDSELVVGLYTADHRSGDPRFQYAGLDDDPSRYRLSSAMGRLTIQDTEGAQPRVARDHRVLVATAWEHAPGGIASNDRFKELAVQAARQPDAGPHTKILLNALLLLLGEVAPVPAAIILFSCGLAGIYHVYRAHRLVGASPDKDDAALILDDARARLEQISDEQAHGVVQALLRHFTPPTDQAAS